MTYSHNILFLLATLTLGCASARPAPVVGAASTDASAPVSAVRPVGYQDAKAPSLAQPIGVAPIETTINDAATVNATAVNSAETNAAEPLALPSVEASQQLPATVGLSVELVEELSLSNHPTVAQAEARLKALNGKWVQVGLKPNPTVGYAAAEINADGSAGQQGGYVGQQFITAKKLERNRAIVCAEISQAEQQLAIVIRRVQTDVRVRFYNTLLAQQRVLLARELVGIAATAADTSQTLVDAAEIPLAGLLQTELQLQNAQLLLRTSENGHDQAWRQLQTLMGSDQLPPQTLVGDVRQLPDALNFEAQLAQIQGASPELAAAMANVTRSRRVLNRECVQAVPDISAQLTVQYDDANSETLTGVQIGIPLPLWDRNQGAICQARAEVTQAVRNVDRVELNLQQRLTDAFRQYADARITAETYATEILTRSEKTLDLIRQGYAQGEVGYLDLLTAQQTFSQTHLAYLDALGSLWQSYLKIEGLLLDGSLETEIQ